GRHLLDRTNASLTIRTHASSPRDRCAVGPIPANCLQQGPTPALKHYLYSVVLQLCSSILQCQRAPLYIASPAKAVFGPRIDGTGESCVRNIVVFESENHKFI